MEQGGASGHTEAVRAMSVLVTQTSSQSPPHRPQGWLDRTLLRCRALRQKETDTQRWNWPLQPGPPGHTGTAGNENGKLKI